ncbi:MAG: sulfurtransferase TusA family protein [Terriglobales bacterium]
MYYEIPASLPAELDELELLVRQHLNGELDAASLKARRVPFGCYEQRKDGTYMVRIRCTGGALTPMQLHAIATLSGQFGGDSIHITTRQEFQIHDLALENVVPVMRHLLAAGLATRGGGGNTIRNIMVSPDAGVGTDEVFDPSPYAFALTSRLIAEPDSWVLPRKFKIAFSNSPKDTAYAQFNDLGFIATVRDGVQGFKVYIAGGMGAKPEVAHLLHEFIPAGDVYVVAAAAKRLFDKHGNRKNKHAARLRFLWNQLGGPRFRELYQLELEAVRQQQPPALTVHDDPPHTGTPSLLPLHDETSEFQLWKRRYVKAQRQHGLYSVLVPVLLGNLRNQEAIALAAFLAPFGRDVLRATMGQNLRLRNIPEAYLGNVYQAVKNVSELSSAPALLANSIACTGADTCKLGVCLPKGALQAIARNLTKSGIDLDQISDFKLNLSGCPNTCGQHMVADLGFYGKVGRKGQQMFPAYGVVAGAVVGDGAARLAHNLDRISARDLPSFIADVLRTWVEKKSRFASFAEYIDGEGAQDIRALCDRYRDVPEFEDDKNYYFDWGASEVFSLIGKGMGECSAGLFDLIEVDLKQIKKTQRELASGLPTPEADEALYHIVLLAARMLLITRGIEAQSDSAVFASFSKHFITAGLVDAHFQQVIDAAQDRNFAELRRLTDEVHALAAAIEKLYAGMDNSLRFPAETAKAGPPRKPVAAETALFERDYRTVACPMNFVKVKLDLSRMQHGQRLKVLLGDGAPIENVPRSVAQEGHKVLEQIKLGDYWAVLIEKSTGAGA